VTDLDDATRGAARRDASGQYSCDASPTAPCDTSPAAASDTSRVDQRRVCTWCARQLGPELRRDAKACSKKCRQAAHRFRVGVAPAGTTGPMRFAYADPPYPGLARRYYDCAEVDHEQLIARLVADFPHGWALSTSASALPDVLRLCPPGARVAAWVRGPRKVPARRALNAWEPLIVVGGRARQVAVVEDLCDVLLWGGRQHSHPGALVGMKPAAFCEWMFRLLGAAQGDELVDLFTGSGAVTRAWKLYTSQEYSRDASARAGSDVSPPPAAETPSAKACDDASRLEVRRLPSRLAGAARRLFEKEPT
jgi:hypothetical protein